jgi:hypothetical protein
MASLRYRFRRVVFNRRTGTATDTENLQFGDIFRLRLDSAWHWARSLIKRLKKRGAKSLLWGWLPLGLARLTPDVVGS